MKRIIISISTCLFLIFTNGISQDSLPAYSYSASYFGNNVWNEGLNFGIEKHRYSYPKSNNREKERTIVKSHVLNVGFYNDSGSHLGMFAVAGWGTKKVFANRFNLQTNLQPIGIYRSFLSETYKVKNNGDIKKVILPGRYYLSPSISLGFGRVGKRNPKNGWYSRVNLMTLLPYNKAILPLLNVEFGYHFILKS